MPISPGSRLRDESEGVGGESLSPFRLALRHYRRNWVAMFALGILILIVLACLFPSIPARYSETQRLPKTGLDVHQLASQFEGLVRHR